MFKAYHAPKDIYGPNAFRMFVHELGGPKSVAKFLEVTERTVCRWLAEEKVPRAAVLALYWETQYGRSQIFTDQVNEIRLLYRRVCILQEQYTRAKSIVAGIRKLHTGGANEAFFDEMPDFAELPPDTYGAPPLPSTAIEAQQQQSNTLPPPQPARPVSTPARNAMAIFQQTRKVRAG